MLEAMLAARLGEDSVYVDPTPKTVTTRNVTYVVTFVNATEAAVGVALVNSGALGPLVLAAAVQTPVGTIQPPPSPSAIWERPVVASVAAGGAVVVAAVIGLVVYNAVGAKAVGSAAAAAGSSYSSSAAADLDYVPMKAINSV
jgi:hypothetical protein